jgi:ribonuclease T1
LKFPRRLVLEWAARSLAALFFIFVLAAVAPVDAGGETQSITAVAAQALPAEARQTLRLLREGGPYPYERDGVVFGNRERLLPQRARGYYREYTVPTPGLTHRGPRRIVAGRGGELYYTDDHYRSFRRITE